MSKIAWRHLWMIPYLFFLLFRSKSGFKIVEWNGGTLRNANWSLRAEAVNKPFRPKIIRIRIYRIRSSRRKIRRRIIRPDLPLLHQCITECPCIQLPGNDNSNDNNNNNNNNDNDNDKDYNNTTATTMTTNTTTTTASITTIMTTTTTRLFLPNVLNFVE